MPSTRWLIPGSDDAATAALSAALGISPLAARVLVHRGLAEPDAARRFLRPSLDDLHDPLLLRDMPQAVARLQAAIGAGEKILIYGDYDVDGTASVVILKKAIELAGGSASYHVPHRLKDGYGMRLEVRFWIADPMNGVNNVRSDVNREIWRLFKKHGITIPVQQHDVRMIPPGA